MVKRVRKLAPKEKLIIAGSGCECKNCTVCHLRGLNSLTSIMIHQSVKLEGIRSCENRVTYVEMESEILFRVDLKAFQTQLMMS